MNHAPERLCNLLLLTCCALLLSACSSTRLAYNNLDWLAIWAIEDYVPLNDAQEQALQSALGDHLQWHCATQLPAYVQWLEGLAGTIKERDFDRETLDGHLNAAFGFLGAIGEEISPTAAATLSGLDEDQVAALFDNLAERNRELREKHLEPPLAEQVKNRAERLEGRLERWFGELSNEQRQLISAWAQQRGAQNKAWLAGREQWQAALADTLRARHEPGFERRVYALLNDPGRFRTAEYNGAMEKGRGQSVDLTQRLLAVSSERQLAHVLDELGSLSADLQALSCPAS